MVTPISWLERNPVYRDADKQLRKGDTLSTGFLLYPLLQTADIAAYKATHVPIGGDQEPHLEISRRVIRRFNDRMGEAYFPEPQSVFTPTQKIVGTDGKKMSKSKGNSILPGESVESLTKKVRKLVTDKDKLRFDINTGQGDSGDPEICSVYTLQNYFAKNPSDIYTKCTSGTIGCGDCKGQLSSSMDGRLDEFRYLQSRYSKDLDYVKDVITEGSRRAKDIASNTLKEVKDKLKLF